MVEHEAIPIEEVLTCQTELVGCGEEGLERSLKGIGYVIQTHIKGNRRIISIHVDYARAYSRSVPSVNLTLTPEGIIDATSFFAEEYGGDPEKLSKITVDRENNAIEFLFKKAGATESKLVRLSTQYHMETLVVKGAETPSAD